MIVASSSSVYGANPTLPKHEDLATFPLSPYAASKLATEAYALAYQHSFGLPVLAFRFFNVFGPLQAAGHAYAAVVPAFVRRRARRASARSCTATASRAATSPTSTPSPRSSPTPSRAGSRPEPVNLAFGTRTEILGWRGMSRSSVGRPLEIEHTEARVGDVRHSQADPTRLRELFPDVVPDDLPDALRATVDWFRAGA